MGNDAILKWIRAGRKMTPLIEEQFYMYEQLADYLQNSVPPDDIEEWKTLLNESKFVWPTGKFEGWAKIFGKGPQLLAGIEFKPYVSESEEDNEEVENDSINESKINESITSENKDISSSSIDSSLLEQNEKDEIDQLGNINEDEQKGLIESQAETAKKISENFVQNEDPEETPKENEQKAKSEDEAEMLDYTEDIGDDFEEIGEDFLGENTSLT